MGKLSCGIRLNSVVCIALLAPFFISVPERNNVLAEEAVSSERIVFNVKLQGLKIGTAYLQDWGIVKETGRSLHLFEFNTQTVNFTDRELIYADPINFLPVRIERKIKWWGRAMNIREEYDIAHNKVRIIHLGGGKDTTEEITKSSPLQNIILAIYQYRQKKDLKVGEKFTLNLPTRQLQVEVQKIVSFRGPQGKVPTFFMKGSPGRFRLWLENNPRRLPLQIEGVMLFGTAALVLAETP